jgi:HD-GYP domain-containing protein (c-di-GMP phosphodiesterase class II)
LKSKVELSKTAFLMMEEASEDFIRPFEYIASSKDLNKEIDSVEEDFQVYFEKVNKELCVEEWSVKNVESEYLSINESLTGLLNSFKDYNISLRETLIIFNNTTTFISLFLVAVLAFIILRFLYTDLPYMMKGFMRLERHEYKSQSEITIKPIFEEEKIIQNLVETIFDEQSASTAFKNQVMETYMMDEIIEKLYERVNRIFSIQRIGVAFVDYSKQVIMAEHGVLESGKVHLGPGFQVDFQETSLTELLKTKKPQINNDLTSYFINHNKSGSLKLILAEGMKSNMVVPLVSNDTVFGFLFFSSKEKYYFIEDHLRIVEKFSYEISGFINRAYLTKVILSKITASFAELVDRKDNETGGHILRMVSYSVIVAQMLEEMKLKDYPVDKKMVLEIKRNAATHDIGKVGIPDAILKKPGKLTPEEWEIMKTHAAIGGDIFASLRKDMTMFDQDFYQVAEEITRYHHEKFDGTGYPYGLKGHDIPLVARIVTVADVFDALTSKRVYKDAFSFEKAVEIIHESSGTQFDPKVVEAFDLAIDEIYHVYACERETED